MEWWTEWVVGRSRCGEGEVCVREVGGGAKVRKGAGGVGWERGQGASRDDPEDRGFKREG